MSVVEFPQVPEITEFEGPDENPFSDDGRWGATRESSPPVRRVSNSIRPTVEFAVNRSTYYRSTFHADSETTLEVFACTDGGQLGAALESWRVNAMLDPHNLVGYELIFGGGISKGYFLRRYDPGGFTGLAEAGDGYPQKIGLRITSVGVEAWGNDAGVWSQKLTSGDTTYRGRFYVGVGFEEQGGIDELAMSCFGVGIPRRTQFFRWTRGYKEEVLVA